MLGYASLTEVWGGDPPNLQGGKKKKRAAKGVCPPLLRDGPASSPVCEEATEPICDLYRGDMDNIMDTYLEAYPFDKYERVTKEKEPFPYTYAEERVPRQQSVEVQGKDTESYDLTGVHRAERSGYAPHTAQGPDNFYEYDKFYGDELDTLERVEKERRERAEARRAAELARLAEDPCPKETFEPLQESTNSHTRAHHRGRVRTNVLDLVAYILGGVLLIFIMEQFVKIGLLLRSVPSY